MEAGISRIGILDKPSNQVVDVCAVDQNFTSDMTTLIEQGAASMMTLREVLISGNGRLSLDQVTLLSPIIRPRRNIICVGKNYPEHVDEVSRAMSANKTELPKWPIFFTKATTAVLSPQEAIPASSDPTHSADYEGELAVVIGTEGRDISREQAMSHIFGYTIVNDVTSRRLQKQHYQWFLGKSLDGFCPLGPSIVTTDEVVDVDELVIETHVNDELRQWGQVRQMIFSIPELIECLSKVMTLLPGDIIATGTPSGVGMGFNPPRFLIAGDRVSITIDPIGELANTVC